MSLVSRDIQLFGAVIISDQACPVVPQQQKTCNSVRRESAKQIETARFMDINYENGNCSMKTLFRKKLRADCSQGILAIIRGRMFCIPVCYPKIEQLRHTEL
jgi:hypothetical protein